MFCKVELKSTILKQLIYLLTCGLLRKRRSYINVMWKLHGCMQTTLYIWKGNKIHNTWNKYFDEFCQIASFDAHKYLFWCTFATYDSRAFLTANYNFYDETCFASLLAFWHKKIQSLWIEKKRPSAPQKLKNTRLAQIKEKHIFNFNLAAVF